MAAGTGTISRRHLLAAVACLLAASLFAGGRALGGTIEADAAAFIETLTEHFRAA